MGTDLRVAVAGASGIGKHHAKWHHVVGSEVVAFLGSTEASCRKTAAALEELFGYSGPWYCDMDELLAHERPDIVDVCTSNHLHSDHATAALEAGCHVLCEKPLVWEDGTPANELLARGRQLVELAEERGCLLAVCTQYAASLPHYGRLYGLAGGREGPPTEFFAEMETLSRGRERDGEAIWIDMGSHPLSLLLACLPEGNIAAGSLRVESQRSEVRALFDFVEGENRCAVDMCVRDRPEGKPLRRFGINGVVADCEGRADADGVYRTVLSRGDHEVMDEDFMSLLIREFSAAVRDDGPSPLVSGSVGVRNLELQLEILGAARDAG